MHNENNELNELFESLGLDCDFEAEDLGDNGGFTSIYQLENPNSTIKPLEFDYGKKHLICIPTWLILPFDLRTGKRLPQGKFMTSIALKMTPDEIVYTVCKMAAKSDEYRENVRKVLAPKNPNAVFEYDPVTGKIDPETVDLFLPYVNYFSVTEMCQRFMVSPDMTITRKALMKTNAYGKIDYDNTDPRLVSRYLLEASAVAAECKRMEEFMKKDGKTTAETIRTTLQGIRSQRIMTPPRATSVLVAFCFESDSSGMPINDVASVVNSDTYNIAYSLRYLTVNPNIVSKLKDILQKNIINHVSYFLVTRVVPDKDKTTNKGTAAQGTSYDAIGNRINQETVITNLSERINEAIKTENLITEEKIRASVTKFNEYSIEDALECFSNGIRKYSEVLSLPEIVSRNKAVLKEIEEDLGLQIVKDTVGEIEAVSVSYEDAEKEDLEAYFDTQDVETDTGAEAQASDFV